MGSYGSAAAVVLIRRTAIRAGTVSACAGSAARRFRCAVVLVDHGANPILMRRGPGRVEPSGRPPPAPCPLASRSRGPGRTVAGSWACHPAQAGHRKSRNWGRAAAMSHSWMRSPVCARSYSGPAEFRPMDSASFPDDSDPAPEPMRNLQVDRLGIGRRQFLPCYSNIQSIAASKTMTPASTHVLVKLPVRDGPDHSNMMANPPSPKANTPYWRSGAFRRRVSFSPRRRRGPKGRPRRRSARTRWVAPRESESLSMRDRTRC